MKIAHYKKTPIALAPDELSDCINKYTKHESFVNENFNECDVIQYHNRYIYITHLSKYNINKNNLIKKPSFILYHSFPEITDNYKDVIMANTFIIILKKIFGRKSLSIFLNKKKSQFVKKFCSKKNDPIKQMVIGQYQATLSEFKSYKIMKNIIDFNKEIYNVNILKNNKIKIGYSPSITKKSTRSIWETKGYRRTIYIIKNIAKLYNIDYDIITNVPFKECLERKSRCNIIIDECVTGSYHKSALEGLALGKMTICSISNEVEQVIKNASGSNTIPFQNIWITELEIELKKIISLGSKYINSKGLENRLWMEKYWDPKKIATEYTDYYFNKKNP